MKSLLGFKAKGRDVVKGDEGHHLREEAAPYMALDPQPQPGGRRQKPGRLSLGPGMLTEEEQVALLRKIEAAPPYGVILVSKKELAWLTRHSCPKTETEIVRKPSESKNGRI